MQPGKSIPSRNSKALAYLDMVRVLEAVVALDSLWRESVSLCNCIEGFSLEDDVDPLIRGWPRVPWNPSRSRQSATCERKARNYCNQELGSLIRPHIYSLPDFSSRRWATYSTASSGDEACPRPSMTGHEPRAAIGLAILSPIAISLRVPYSPEMAIRA